MSIESRGCCSHRGYLATSRCAATGGSGWIRSRPAKAMRELVTKYGDHMQTHLVDAIRGHCAQEMRQPGVAIHPRLRSGPDADDCMPASMTLAMRSIHFPAWHHRLASNAMRRTRSRATQRSRRPCHSRRVGTEFKTVSLAKKPILQPNNNALRCLRKLAR